MRCAFSREIPLPWYWQTEQPESARRKLRMMTLLAIKFLRGQSPKIRVPEIPGLRDGLFHRADLASADVPGGAASGRCTARRQGATLADLPRVGRLFAGRVMLFHEFLTPFSPNANMTKPW